LAAVTSMQSALCQLIITAKAKFLPSFRLQSQTINLIILVLSYIAVCCFFLSRILYSVAQCIRCTVWQSMFSISAFLVVLRSGSTTIL